MASACYGQVVISLAGRAILDEVLARVAAADAPGGVPPVVMVDLDLCGLVPLRRTLRAIRLVSGLRAGAPRGIAEFRRAESLPGLPCYPAPAWARFVQAGGFDARYPAVDWAAVHAEFCTAFFRPWHGLRTDEVTPGLVEFAAEVEAAGGTVVFNTARRERVRGHTEHVLGAHGLGHLRLLTHPDRRTGSVTAHKVDALRALAPARIVAVFDDLTENRRAFAAAYPDALVVAVELAGFRGDRAPGGPPPDGVPLLSDFHGRSPDDDRE